MTHQPADLTCPPTLLADCLADLHARFATDFSGAPADYIPELSKADPAHFGIALMTADGQSYTVGDSRVPFTIQSISKAFVYGLALEDHGLEGVLGKVGVEPSGDAFNAIVFDERTNRPFNPMVNAGAICTTALIKGADGAERMARITEMFRRYTGRVLDIDETVYRSEAATGHRNRAITWLMLNSGMVDDRVDEHLDLYFRQCSLLVTAEDLALISATLANGGLNPVTGERALEARYVKHVTAVMASCGMYDYAGEWLYRVGLPAKSGVGGGIVAMLPGQMGIGTYSPPLDDRGNSVRGIRTCEELSRRFGLHVFDAGRPAQGAVARVYRGDTVRSKVMRRAAERQALDAAGGRIAVLEVQGDLLFAAAEQVLRQAERATQDAAHLILDLHRVGRMGAAAPPLLARLAGALEARGISLAVAAAPADAQTALRVEGLPATAFVDTLDEALERAEEAVLADCLPAAGQADADAPAPLGSMELLAGLSDDELARVATRVKAERRTAGAVILRHGDEADALYFLARGRVGIRVTADDGRSVRLTTVAPGVAFGDMALLDGGTRSADAVAETDCDLLRLDLPSLRALMEERPGIGLTIMTNLARIMSGRLRRANAELRTLAQ